jgi:hypothetical protein
VASHPVSAIAATLDEPGTRWALMDALAANRYRDAPQSTNDVDFLLEPPSVGIDALEYALRVAGWDVRRAAAAGELLRLRHPRYGIADLIISGTVYQLNAIRRSQIETIEGDVRVRVSSVEDVIVHKLIAGRAQDLADIEAILAAKPSLDVDYVGRWAEFWDRPDLWRRLSAAG